MLRRIILYAPLSYSEELNDQVLGLGLAEELRRDVERLFGVVDPGRSGDVADAQDVYALPRILREGYPTGRIGDWIYSFSNFCAWCASMHQLL